MVLEHFYDVVSHVWRHFQSQRLYVSAFGFETVFACSQTIR